MLICAKVPRFRDAEEDSSRSSAAFTDPSSRIAFQIPRRALRRLGFWRLVRHGLSREGERDGERRGRDGLVDDEKDGRGLLAVGVRLPVEEAEGASCAVVPAMRPSAWASRRVWSRGLVCLSLRSRERRRSRSAASSVVVVVEGPCWKRRVVADGDEGEVGHGRSSWMELEMREVLKRDMSYGVGG